MTETQLRSCDHQKHPNNEHNFAFLMWRAPDVATVIWPSSGFLSQHQHRVYHQRQLRCYVVFL